jgi:hypothetical protein
MAHQVRFGADPVSYVQIYDPLEPASYCRPSCVDCSLPLLFGNQQDPRQSVLDELMQECDLGNLHNIPGLDPEQELQNTYRSRNKRQINFMLGTSRICMCVQRCGALEYNDGIVSNHRGLYVDQDTAALFGGATDDQIAASLQGFTLKNKKKTKKYWDALGKISLTTRSAPKLTYL